MEFLKKAEFPEIDTSSPEVLLDSIYAFCIKYEHELVVDQMFDSISYDANKIHPTLEMVNKYPFLNSSFSIRQCLECHPNWMDVYESINLKHVFAIVYIFDSVNGSTGNGDELIVALGWSVKKSDALKWAEKLTKIANKYIPERLIEYMDDKVGETFRSVQCHYLPNDKCDQMISELSECLNGVVDVRKLLTFYGECAFDSPLQFRVLRVPVIDTRLYPRDDDPDSDTMECDNILPVPNNRKLFCINGGHDMCDIDCFKPVAFAHDEEAAKKWAEQYEVDNMYYMTDVRLSTEFS